MTSIEHRAKRFLICGVGVAVFVFIRWAMGW